MKAGDMNRIEKQEMAYDKNRRFRVHPGTQVLFVAVIVFS